VVTVSPRTETGRQVGSGSASRLMSSRKFRTHDDEDDNSTFYSRSTSSRSSSMSMKDRSDHEQRRMYGAGIASGVIGLLVGAGPLVAIVAGLGTAYATEQPGAAGTTARALGDAAVMAQELDRKHKIVAKAKDAALRSCHIVAKYVQEKRLVEHGIDVVGRVAYWVAEQLSEQVLAQQRTRQGLLEED
jgi:hypothetical protein